MAAAKNAIPVAKNNASALVGWLAGASVGAVALLLAGGYWLQSQRTDQALQRQQAATYQSYRQSSQPTVAPSAAPRMVTTEALETRKLLLAHPAVTPGTEFDKPGVQSTGRAIIEAIDKAKGL